MGLCTESKIVVRYAETDRMGGVYYANYLIWMEVGRTDYLAEIGFPYSSLERDGVLFPACNASIRLFRPSYYEDRLAVLTSVECLQSRKLCSATGSCGAMNSWLAVRLSIFASIPG